MSVSKPAGQHDESLLRRTLVATGALLLGSAAFVGLVSFLLVTAIQSVLPSHGGAAEVDVDHAEAAVVDEAPAGGATKPIIRPKRTGSIVNKQDSKEKTDDEQL